MVYLNDLENYFGNRYCWNGNMTVSEMYNRYWLFFWKDIGPCHGNKLDEFNKKDVVDVHVTSTNHQRTSAAL